MSPIYVPGKVVLKKDPVLADRYYNDVSLLLRGDALTDSSRFASAVTSSGATIGTPPAYPNGNTAFGNAFSFDGNNDYISVARSSIFDFGTGDFTIELWARYTSASGSQALVSNLAGALGWEFFGDGTNLYFYANGAIRRTVSMSGIAAGTWYHLAVTRSNGDIRIFINGSTAGSSTYTADVNGASSVSLTVGIENTSNLANDFNGWIDEVRITKGIARYTANFTPPIAPFSEVVG